VESPLASRGESVFINITTLGAEEKLKIQRANGKPFEICLLLLAT
jgi:hypothetical protein